MEEAARADRVIVINDGRLIMDSTARDVFSNVDLLHSIGLEAPQGAELIDILRKDGLDIEGDSLSEEESVNTLLKFLKDKGEKADK